MLSISRLTGSIFGSSWPFSALGKAETRRAGRTGDDHAGLHGQTYSRRIPFHTNIDSPVYSPLGKKPRYKFIDDVFSPSFFHDMHRWDSSVGWL